MGKTGIFIQRVEAGRKGSVPLASANLESLSTTFSGVCGIFTYRLCFSREGMGSYRSKEDLFNYK